MALSLDEAFKDACMQILDTNSLVRVVLSGRRRNMSTEHERIDIRPVEIKTAVLLQLSYGDGSANTVKNLAPEYGWIFDLLASGYAHILVEQTEGSTSIRITKRGDAQRHYEKRSLTQNLDHDKKKRRLLDPSDPFLLEVGIADHKGLIKPSKKDKYMQVEEFLRLLVPTLESAIAGGDIHQPTEKAPLSIVDLGCGHAYLTFAAHQYLSSIGVPVMVTGIDLRAASRERNNTIAQNLGISSTITFRAEEIATTTAQHADVVIALHACDTATDDTIAWAVNGGAKLLLIAPCCHHDIQQQMQESPEPWGAVTKFGLMKERLGDLITDSLRAQILRIMGYRVEIIEFIGGEHTPRNLMIRAVKSDASPEAIELLRYRQICTQWGIKPALEKKLPSFFIG
ncbi:MAG: SAM-dependent methyltransferase [Actinomycetota bacterium]|nr:SAM-dependent methyltransferase [Actinomycetota bacterium]